MYVPSARFLAFIVVVAGLGFAGWSLAVRSPYSPWYVARWEEVGENLRRMEFISEDEVNVLLYAFDPANFSLRIENSEEPERVKTWASQIPGEHIIVNGFYFLEDHAPAGLLITDGKEVSEVEFDYDKSGIIRLEPNFDIVDTGFEVFSTREVVEAGQSYPFLLKEGVGSIKEDSGLVARRTFMGTDRTGQVYVGVVWRDDVSLYELMNVLQEVDIDWYDVMNLDGGPSTGLMVETEGFVEALDSAALVPNVIVIQPK